MKILPQANLRLKQLVSFNRARKLIFDDFTCNIAARFCPGASFFSTKYKKWRMQAFQLSTMALNCCN
jgi:hypothetical protein